MNHKRISRLMRELRLLAKRKISRKRTTNSGETPRRFAALAMQDSVHGYKRYQNLVKGLIIERLLEAAGLAYSFSLAALPNAL